MDKYLWFCLDHIRERNQQWNYFAGMDSEEIEAFIRDSVTGHRPTWSREGGMREHYWVLQDKFYEFLTGSKQSIPKQPIPARLRNALSLLELEYPYTMKQLKLRYRILVKKHHPDANKGNRESEEKFKKITTAYKYLCEQMEK